MTISQRGRAASGDVEKRGIDLDDRTRRAYAARKKKQQRQNVFRIVVLVVFCVLSFLLGRLTAPKEKDGGAGSPSSVITTPEVTTPQTPNVTTAETSAPGETSAPVTTAEPTAKTPAKQDDWRLLLVNPEIPLPESFTEPALTQLKNGHAVDSRIYQDLQQMMDDARAAGVSPLICSSYRSVTKQTELFNNKVAREKADGKSEEDAKAAAATAVAIPGTSEHHTGLALDIVDVANQNLTDEQENTEAQKWLMKNSWQYGFILRYPKDKQDITGIIYEPWHYRYVGKEAAKEITDQGICLEEYLGVS